MTSDQPDAPSPRPTNPGEVAGGTYGHDEDAIARRSRAHKDKDTRRPKGGEESALDDEPGARTP